MKVEELRIGNLVFVNDQVCNPELEGVTMIVKEIYKDRLVCDYMLVVSDIINRKTHNVSIGDIKPIPLTEEVLLKCGFEIKPDSSLPTFVYSGRLDLQVEFMLGEYSFRIEVENRHTTFVRVIKYLHELQNLYFSITGEELEVEL